MCSPWRGGVSFYLCTEIEIFVYNVISMDWISVKCSTANEKHCIINSRAASETASGKYFSEPVN